MTEAVLTPVLSRRIVNPSMAARGMRSAAELLRQSNELRAQLLLSSRRIEQLLPQASANLRG